MHRGGPARKPWMQYFLLHVSVGFLFMFKEYFVATKTFFCWQEGTSTACYLLLLWILERC